MLSWIFGWLLMPVAAAAAPAPKPDAPPSPAPWQQLLPGLELGEFPSTRAVVTEDAVIRIVRIDPDRFALKLLNASAPGEGHPHTAREWARQHGLAAVINASMYQEDLRKSVSLMRTGDHVNNPRVSKDKAFLAFDRLRDDLPPVQIIDRECQDFETLRQGYGSLVQSIRMVSCTGRNVWASQPQTYSIAAIGIDRRGRVLFIHARAPHTTHDLIEMLLELPIELKNAMYVEGGPEAQLFVQAGSREMEFTGAIDPGAAGASGARLAWPVPNVIGAIPKSAAALSR